MNFSLFYWLLYGCENKFRTPQNDKLWAFKGLHVEWQQIGYLLLDSYFRLNCMKEKVNEKTGKNYPN